VTERLTVTPLRPAAPEGSGPTTAWQAFAALQQALTTVPFDSQNPHFGNKYASLAKIVEALRPLLGQYGFAWSATPGIWAGLVAMPYRLIWRDGTVVAEGTYPLPQDAKPQELGSAITYGRRYTLCAALNVVADEDDDGEAASRPPDRPTAAVAPRTAPPSPGPVRTALGRNCPTCGDGALEVIQTKAGARFVGCSNYPQCRYTERPPRDLTPPPPQDGPAIDAYDDPAEIPFS
jgi:hypothetical protein